MPKKILRAPEPEPLVANTRPRRYSRARKVRDEDYDALQAAKGFRQIKIWVPEVTTDWLYGLALDMRALGETGYNPLTAHEKLPYVAQLPDKLIDHRRKA